MTPTKIVVSGNIPKGKLFIGQAKQQMHRLIRDMSFQGLREGFNVTRPFPGVIIQCWKSHSLKSIEIYVEPYGGIQPPPLPKKEEWKDCFCVHHFSLGIITVVTPEDPGEEGSAEAIEAYSDFLLSNGRFIYDAELCDTRRYILYEGIYSAGWEKYNVGQFVLVTMGDDDPVGSYDCERKCLIDDPEFEVLIVSPIYALGKMKKWRYLTM